MISGERAQQIAEAHAAETGRGLVDEVVAGSDLGGRRINVYGAPPLETCWIAYLRRPDLPFGIRSSEIVMICRVTGDVLYSGSAGDEG